jgi:hypothetical protein
MKTGTCPLANRRGWAAWVVDDENRPLWSSFVMHATETEARAAAERALADLLRGVAPTER